jgi:hypothetical protein
MDKTIARLNIEHYRRLLTRESDEARRQKIELLLAEEEAKLAEMHDAPEEEETGSQA